MHRTNMEYRFNLLKCSNSLYRANFQICQVKSNALFGIEFVRAYNEYRISALFFNFTITKNW